MSVSERDYFPHAGIDVHRTGGPYGPPVVVPPEDDIPPPPEPPGDEDPHEGRTGPQILTLPFLTFDELADRVDRAGPRSWLIRGIWPAGDYGVIGAEHKAGKTWTVIELAVAVASGTPFLGTFPIDTSGPVILFAGEGGEGNIVRRIRAVCDAYAVSPAGLPIHICTRAPQLGQAVHRALMAERVEAVRPALVVLDPLYLSMSGAKGAELYSMGELLQYPQHIAQEFGASLVVSHHLNRKAQGPSTSRLSGAGPAEWGRVLIAGDVKSRRTDLRTRATTVTTRWDVIGGEVPDQTIEVVRTMWSDDPDDLNAALHLTVDAERVDDDRRSASAGDDGETSTGDRGQWADALRWPVPQDVRDLAAGGRGGGAVLHLAQYMREYSRNPAGVGVGRVEAVKALRAQLQGPDGKPLYRDDTVIRRAWDRLLQSGRLRPRTKTPTGPALWVVRDTDQEAR